MKNSLIISLLLLISCQLFAQSQYLYRGGDTVVGKNVKYICKPSGSYVNVDNILNKDTTYNMYYDNGELVETLEEIDAIDATNKYDCEDLHRIAKMIFTKDELTVLKNENVVLYVFYVSNKQGEALEVGFRFMKSAPILSTLDPDRLYELEKKLKVVLRIDIAESSRNIRNPKWMDSIDFREIE